MTDNRRIVHTPELEDAGIVESRLVPGEMELIAVAQTIGANLYFTDNAGSLALQWEPLADPGNGEAPESLPLPILAPPPTDSYYKITFNNDCRNPDNFICLDKLRDSGYHSDVPLYYDSYYNLFETPPAEGRLDFRPRGNQRGFEFPCIPVEGP